MDSDDVMHPRRIELQFNFNQKDDIDLVSSRVEYKALNESNFNGEGYSLYVDWSNRIISNEQINLHQFEESPFAHPSVAFRMKLTANLVATRRVASQKITNFGEMVVKKVKMEKLPQSLLAWYDFKRSLGLPATIHQILLGNLKRYTCLYGSNRAICKIEKLAFGEWVKLLKNRSIIYSIMECE